MPGGIQAPGSNLYACNVYNGANQSLAASTITIINMSAENQDTAAMHFTSAAALTGTVTKTSGAATLAGVGTAFLTELSVGQVITIPGTATEKFVVIAIATNTAATLNRNAANTAAGQTATRQNSPIVCRLAGTYVIGGICRFASNATGYRQALIIKNNLVAVNDGSVLVNTKVVPVTGDSTDWGLPTPQVPLNLWDYIELVALQTTGGALNVETIPPSEPSLWMYRIGPL